MTKDLQPLNLKQRLSPVLDQFVIQSAHTHFLQHINKITVTPIWVIIKITLGFIAFLMFLLHEISNVIKINPQRDFP